MNKNARAGLSGLDGRNLRLAIFPDARLRPLKCLCDHRKNPGAAGLAPD